LTEKELIQGCIDKNQICQRELFDTYAGKMMSVCQRYTNDAHTAQDILQEGFIRLFRFIGQYQHNGSFEGWMRRIFVHVALRHISLQKMSFNTVEPETPAFDLSADAIQKMSEDEIHQLIRQLPEGYRLVFNLHVVEGYSFQEIGELLHIEQSTARSQLFKARKMLQALIVHQQKPVSA
jgi:RNA polymerase sigma factor (sigma-70 family)